MELRLSEQKQHQGGAEQPGDIAACEAAPQHERPTPSDASFHGGSHIIGLVQIAVIGIGADWAPQAEEVGELLAARGCVVVCGGLGEVMEAVARGAKKAGGTTVGVLPGESPKDANRWIDYAVAKGTGHARNLAVVAVGGRWGTAAEVSYARLLGRPVVVLGPGPPVDGEGVEHADTPADAVERALELAGAH